MENKIIGLITDFGTEDGYVGAMKGKIYSLIPTVTIVDISHDIKPFDIRGAAFCLLNSHAYFPPGTIFVVVVDPGVGTERHGIVLRTEKHIFIGPDNGVFSFIIHHQSFTAEKILLDKLPWEISDTFHGRDVFAPLAAMMAKGLEVHKYLAPHTSVSSFFQAPRKMATDRFAVQVVHIDHFGNIILNFHRSDLPQSVSPRQVELQSGFLKLKGIRKTFGEVPVGDLILCWDSSGYLQIARNQGSAAQKLNLTPGQELIVKI